VTQAHNRSYREGDYSAADALYQLPSQEILGTELLGTELLFDMELNVFAVKEFWTRMRDNGCSVQERYAFRVYDICIFRLEWLEWLPCECHK
jgi:hypothetical protein